MDVADVNKKFKNDLTNIIQIFLLIQLSLKANTYFPVRSCDTLLKKVLVVDSTSDVNLLYD